AMVFRALRQRICALYVCQRSECNVRPGRQRNGVRSAQQLGGFRLWWRRILGRWLRRRGRRRLVGPLSRVSWGNGREGSAILAKIIEGRPQERAMHTRQISDRTFRAKVSL